ncbi:DsbA family protein [uncultured Roseobacter sp.]|uniref:DsbA family protein n=1 Tax=uncultured Roseobacter sp. TaxID=114847 RepID=UPI00262D1436|nr:DsbA family protein [uncultured Roseobacter sp.]
MKRRDLLILGGAVGLTMAVPPLLRRDPPLQFEEIPGAPGFRRLVRDNVPAAPDLFAGIVTPTEEAAMVDLPEDICPLIFGELADVAQVPVAVFSDYYCPYCSVLDARLARMKAEGSPIRLMFHELPMLGDRSIRAARLALAAARQGDHTTLHLDLMKRTIKPGAAGVADIARRHNLDEARLRKDIVSEDVEQQLQTSLALGRRLEIPATPGMVIGRTVVIGALPEEVLANIIELESDRPTSVCA